MAAGIVKYPQQTILDNRVIRDGTGSLAGAAANGIYLFYPAGALLSSANASAITVMRLDPVYYPAPHGYQLNYIIRGRVVTNDVAPGNVTFNFSLWAVSSVSGASGSGPHVTLGSAVTSLNAQITNPGADSMNSIASPAVAAPAAGWYALGVQLQNGPTAAGSNLQVMARLERVYAQRKP